jgi:quinol monooxygenase YgiN
MYGTVARFRVQPGKLEAMTEVVRKRAGLIPGLLFETVLQSDSDEQNLVLVVGFESKEAYQANASSPEQHASYQEYRAFLESDPEWCDGTYLQIEQHFQNA